ncbi:MAG TPA: flagellar assembly protein FliW [Desulfobacterales bacterium]|nr:flagellar assembly protein FliW [Desulfobacterales bacterium]
MKTIQTRFGEVEYNPDNLLHFPAGMIGFPTLHDFIVMPNKKEGPLFWIQSIDEAAIAFVLTDPNNFFLDYQVKPDESEKNSLNITKDDDCYVLSVVTVPPDQKITLNLAAPILFSPKTNRAIQVILENTEYKSKTPLPA